MHKVAHHLKKVADRHGIQVVFSAPRKLAGLCPRVCGNGQRRSGCGKKHAETFLKCATGVVYQIPLTCGRSYVGQTGRCVNERVGEHATSITRREGANLPAHCSSCMGCEPVFTKVKILGRSKERVGRELLEAFYIKELGDNCVSDTSVTLYSAERNFLHSFCF